MGFKFLPRRDPRMTGAIDSAKIQAAIVPALGSRFNVIGFQWKYPKAMKTSPVLLREYLPLDPLIIQINEPLNRFRRLSIVGGEYLNLAVWDVQPVGFNPAPIRDLTNLKPRNTLCVFGGDTTPPPVLR